MKITLRPSNFWDYLKERKRLNILNKELNCSDMRIRKLMSYICDEIPFSCEKIVLYKTQLQKEVEYRDYLKEQING
jgi:hypothetical protein